MSLPSISFLHVTASVIQPGQTFSHHPPAHPDTMGENNSPTALKSCGVKKHKYIHLIDLFSPDHHCLDCIAVVGMVNQNLDFFSLLLCHQRIFGNQLLKASLFFGILMAVTPLKQ